MNLFKRRIKRHETIRTLNTSGLVHFIKELLECPPKFESFTIIDILTLNIDADVKAVQEEILKWLQLRT